MHDLTDFNKTIIDELLDIDYFNLETSYCCSTFVINASKKGIGNFLKDFAHLEVPPAFISFEKRNRRQRIWKSKGMAENPTPSPSAPTTYMAWGSNGYYNRLHPFLHIRFINDCSDKPILGVGCKRTQKVLKRKIEEEVLPILTVNKLGWKKFLDILKCLQNKCYWFYVTAPRDDNWNHLPFLLTSPYPKDPESPEEHECLGMECIRLEPENVIYLKSHIYVYQKQIWENNKLDLTDPLGACGELYGNSAGSLMFSKWLNDFVDSSESTRDILNIWNDIYDSVRYGQERKSERSNPHLFRFIKTNLDTPYPILAFGAKTDESSDFYIMGNLLGFKQLADKFESTAFFDDDDFFIALTEGPCLYGHITTNFKAPKGIILFDRWDTLLGAFFNASYSVFNKERFVEGVKYEPAGEITKKFINERIYYGSDN